MSFRLTESLAKLTHIHPKKLQTNFHIFKDGECVGDKDKIWINPHSFVQKLFSINKTQGNVEPRKQGGQSKFPR